MRDPQEKSNYIISSKNIIYFFIVYFFALSVQISLTMYFSHLSSVDLFKNIPDLMFLNSDIMIYEYLERIDIVGRKYYIYLATYDSLYALIYSFSGVIFWRFLTQKKTKKYYLAPISIFIAVLFDLAENIAYIKLSMQHPLKSDLLSNIGIYSTSIKLVSIITYIIVIILISAPFIVNKIRNKY